MNVESSPQPAAISVEDRAADDTKAPYKAKSNKFDMAVYEVEQVTRKDKRPLSQLKHQVQIDQPIKKRLIHEGRDSLIGASSLTKLKKVKKKTKSTYEKVVINQFTLDKYPPDIRKAAEKMVETCKSRKIHINEALFNMLKYYNITNPNHREDIKKFYEKCNVFFTSLDTEKHSDTSCLTSMLNKSSIYSISNISKKFITMSDTDIHNIASSPWLTNISSICHGNGFPTAKAMKVFLTLSCLKNNWRGNDEDVKEEPLDQERLNNISSICRCKGLPTNKSVQDFLGQPCLKEGWQNDGDDQAVKGNQINRKLLKRISSICYGTGLPTAESVQTFLKMHCLKKNWNGNDQDVKEEPLDQERLSSITLMSHGKGIPTKAVVQTFLEMPCFKKGWNGDDNAVIGNPTNWMLVKNISSICCKRGIPAKANVEAFLQISWQGDDQAGHGTLLNNKCIFSSISLMSRDKGLPTKKTVQTFLKMSCLKEGWHGDDQAVKNNPLNWKLLKSISSMCNHKGIPTEAAVKDFVKWLPSDKNNFYLSIACRVFSCFGLPTQKNLDKQIKSILDTFNYQEKSAEKMSELVEIKLLALFCAGPKKWCVNIEKIKEFMDIHKSVGSEKTITHFTLQSFIRILVNHGGSGIGFWLKKYNDNQQHQQSLTEILSVSSPLGLAKFAVTHLPESQWLNCIELCKNHHTIPGKKQWDDSFKLRQQVDTKFSFNVSKRMMLEILWPLNKKERLHYSNRMDDLFKIVPSISQLYRIHKEYDLKTMTAFLSACLTWQDTKKRNPLEDLTTMNRLMEGLLIANHYINDCSDIPDLCFSQQTSRENDAGVIIDGNTSMSSNKRLWNFISAMLIELQQTEHQFNKQQLTICPDDDEEVVLPKPEFSIDPTNTTGFVITNWSLTQLTEFFNATEFTDIWYKKPEEEQNIFTISHEKKLTQRKEKTNDTTQHNSKKPMKCISQHLITQLVNIKKPLKPKIWKAIERYAKENLLIDSLCKALDPIIQNAEEVTISDLVKDRVTEKLAQNNALKLAQSQASTSAQNQASSTHIWSLSVRINDMIAEQPSLKSILTQVYDYTVLYEEDLEFLENYRSLMTCTDLTNVIVKIDYTASQNTLDDWTNAFNEQQATEITTNPLGLNFSDIDIYLHGSESNEQDASDFYKFVTDIESEEVNWIDDIMDSTPTNNESDIDAIPSTSKK